MSEAIRCMGETSPGVQCERRVRDGLCPQHKNQISRFTVDSSEHYSKKTGLLTVVSSSTDHSYDGDDSWKNGIKKDLRSEQLEVADESFAVFIDPEQDRCQVRAACGMGKTIMEQASILKYDTYIQETEGRSGKYLYVVPSIALANQMVLDLKNDGVLDVTHDPNDVTESSVLVVHNESKHLSPPHTKNKEEADKNIIKSFLSRPQEEGEPKVVICVVNSIHKIAKSQAEDGGDFDITILDEAHNYASDLLSNKIKKKSSLKPEPGKERKSVRDSGDTEDLPASGNSKVLPIYFNEQPESIQSKNRIFLTASPNLASHETELRFSVDNRNAKEKIIDLDKRVRAGEKSLDVYTMTQTDNDVFGPVLGNEGKGWGHAYAVNKGYLSDTDIKLSEISAYNRQGKAHKATRATKINPSGFISENEDGISFGAYSSIKSTALALATSGGRNTLVFSDRIDEAIEVSDNWKEYVSAEAAVYNNNSPMSSAEAWDILDRVGAGEQEDDLRVISAKLQLLSETASIVSTSSEHNKKDRRVAENFFDDKELGDSGECTCGKPGGWCACARIVSNVDMLSEGISINSIDTVIINRPTRTRDSDITQVMGRASRKFRDKDGNEQKKSAQIVIPRLMQSNIEGVTTSVDDTTVIRPLRAMNRIMNDTISKRLNRSKLQENYSEVAEHNSVSISYLSGEPAGSSITEVTDRIVGGSIDFSSLSPHQARMIQASYSVWENRTSTEYNAGEGKSIGKKFSELPDHIKHSKVQAFALSGGPRAKRRESAEEIQMRAIAAKVTLESLEAHKLYISDIENRAKSGDIIYGHERAYTREMTPQMIKATANIKQWKELVSKELSAQAEKAENEKKRAS